MGVVLIDRTADFSALNLGKVTLGATSVNRNLRMLFDLNTNAATSSKNLLKGGAAATVLGDIAYTAKDLTTSSSRRWVAPVKPASGAATQVIVVTLHANGSNNSYPLGSISGSVGTTGANYFVHGNNTVRFETTVSSTPNGYTAAGALVVSLPVAAGDVGRYEMFVAVLNPAFGLRLYRPRTGAINQAGLSANQYFGYTADVPPYGILGNVAPDDAQTLALVGEWQTVLSADEITTFYAEQKQRLFGAYGVEI